QSSPLPLSELSNRKESAFSVSGLVGTLDLKARSPFPRLECQGHMRRQFCCDGLIEQRLRTDGLPLIGWLRQYEQLPDATIGTKCSRCRRPAPDAQGTAAPIRKNLMQGFGPWCLSARSISTIFGSEPGFLSK